MQKPRYLLQRHHFHGKRIEPPVSIHMLQWPVDEVAGTGVDLLVLGLGYGDVYFHNSKVGRVIGQKKEVWENYIDWRIMRMVEEAARLDTDQVRIDQPNQVWSADITYIPMHRGFQYLVVIMDWATRLPGAGLSIFFTSPPKP